MTEHDQLAANEPTNESEPRPQFTTRVLFAITAAIAVGFASPLEPMVYLVNIVFFTSLIAVPIVFIGCDLPGAPFTTEKTGILKAEVHDRKIEILKFEPTRLKPSVFRPFCAEGKAHGPDRTLFIWLVITPASRWRESMGAATRFFGMAVAVFATIFTIILIRMEIMGQDF